MADLRERMREAEFLTLRNGEQPKIYGNILPPDAPERLQLRIGNKVDIDREVARRWLENRLAELVENDSECVEGCFILTVFGIPVFVTPEHILAALFPSSAAPPQKDGER